MTQPPVRIEALVTPESLSALRAIATMDQRSLDAVLEEAVADLIAKRNVQAPDPAVMDAHRAGRAKFDELYKKLAQ